MTNQKYFTKDELKAEVKAQYQRYLDAGAVYRVAKESYHAPSVKLSNRSRRSKTIGFTCFYHSNQKNNHFTKTELAQAWLDIMTVTHEMWEEVGEITAAATV